MLHELKETIWEFEERFPVHTWKYGDMDVWPVFRTLVFVEYRNHFVSGKNGVVLDWKKAAGRRGLSLGRKIAHQGKKIRDYFLHGMMPRSNAEPVEVAFFGSWYFRTVFEGKLINRFFEPLQRQLEERYRIKPLYVEYSIHSKFKEAYKNHPDNLLFIQDFKRGMAKGKLPKLDIRENEIFRVFFQHADKTFFNEHMQAAIARKVERIYLESLVYERLFRTYRTKYAFCLTFFNEPMFAMLYAASKVGVVTVDLGHGFPSDPDNLVYNKLKNVPQKGYNTLPTIFWVWDEPVKEAMSQWTAGQSRHEVIVGGNTWLEFSRKKIKKRRLSAKKVVLYTMSINLPEDYLLDAMRQTQTSHDWWVRLHPSLSDSMADVERIMVEKSITNYNLYEANSLTLPELLYNCDVHISRNSSAIYESIYYGKKPIIIDKEGVAYYGKYIEDGKAFSQLEQDTDQLVALIQNIPGDKGENQIPDRCREGLARVMELNPEEIDA